MRLSASGRAHVLAVGLALLAVGAAHGESGGARFTDVAAAVGIVYERTPSTTDATLQALKESGPVTMGQLVGSPARTRGVPGVALVDYDTDGDLDIYVTNGPGSPNSLFQNQLVPGGSLAFVDVGLASGADLSAYDSTGVCFGDTDNDGDPELYVLSRGGDANRLLENRGDGTFVDVTGASDVGGYGHGAVSCSMGDVNGDGRLDIYVANAFDFQTLLPLMVEPYALNHPNQLWINDGGNRFHDGSTSAGIGGPPEVTWAVALVDYDLDGDLDILEANDQAALPRAAHGGVDRGPIRVRRNDGTGHFTDATPAPAFIGAHMGIDLADLNHDGHMDMFVSDGGDYLVRSFGVPYQLGDDTTRWYLGDGAGGFLDPGVGDLVAGTFAWGVGTEDYDNDGDTDVIHVGGMEAGFMVESSNPGTVLRNDGSARFTYDAAALGRFSLRRNEQGLALGDLDRDGNVDIVTVSDQVFPEPIPFVPQSFGYASVWDPAFFVPMLRPVPGDQLEWTGVRGDNGTLAVLLNSGSGKASVNVELVGSSGITAGGRAPRDGIGAVVSFTPHNGATAMRPVIGGASYASQHALERHFGLGDASRGTVEVLWPGGVRNRLYDVRAGEAVRLPEIPCSFDTTAPLQVYARCVVRSLVELRRSAVIRPPEGARLLASALRAYFER